MVANHVIADVSLDGKGSCYMLNDSGVVIASQKADDVANSYNLIEAAAVAATSDEWI